MDPQSGVPLHRQLAAALRARIAEGEWPPGALLPPHPRLMHEYAVGKVTVQAAMRALRAEGLVDHERGVGVRVRRDPAEREEVLAEPGQVMSARMPTPQERAEHQMADGVPMIVITHADGWVDVHPADEFVVRFG